MSENETIQSVDDSENVQKNANVKYSSELPAFLPPTQPLQLNIETSSHPLIPANSPAALPQAIAQRKQKAKRHYEQFGEVIRYLTLDEWHQILDVIDNYKHKLMLHLIYHLGCHVGEFTRIQI